MREIIPSRMFKVGIYNEHGDLVRFITKPYPPYNTQYFDTIDEARYAVRHHKDRYGDLSWYRNATYKVMSANVDEEVLPHYYTKPHGGQRFKYTKEELAKIRKDREESYSYGPPYINYPRLPDEDIEGRSEYKIFMDAAGHKPGHALTSDMIDKGRKALKEYQEGIRNRKKKTIKTKSKRKIIKSKRKICSCRKK